MEKKFLVWGLIFGITAIVLGAFGAHALREVLTERQLESFETGTRYQMYHALLLIILSQINILRVRWSLNLIVIGVFLFSFSIYLLSIKNILGLDALTFLGPITPIGGLMLISAWIFLLVSVVKYKITQ